MIVSTRGIKGSINEDILTKLVQGMGHGIHLRLFAFFAMLLAHLQKLSSRRAHSLKLEEDAKRSGRASAAANLLLHGVSALAGTTCERPLQMMGFLSAFLNDGLRQY